MSEALELSFSRRLRALPCPKALAVG